MAEALSHDPAAFAAFQDIMRGCKARTISSATAMEQVGAMPSECPPQVCLTQKGGFNGLPAVWALWKEVITAVCECRSRRYWQGTQP